MNPLKVCQIQYLELHQQIKTVCMKKLRADCIQECALSFGPESSIIQFAIQKYKC
jgi:hypothetical protein